MYLSYEEFINKLDKKIIIGEDFYVQLLQTVIDNPNRYTGIFRISSVKTKLIQNVTQSNEIKFGDFMEDIVTDYIEKLGYQNIKKNIGTNNDGDTLNTDQLFMDKNNILYLIEQKIRDDHDSTKKRGQFENFIKKVNLLIQKYPGHALIASMWFIDDGMKKNKNFYNSQLNNFSQSNITLKLFYGSDMFKELLNAEEAWKEIVDYLIRNKINRTKGVLEIPDFDTSDEMLQALNKISKLHRRKLFSDSPQYVQLRRELFPNNVNLSRVMSI